MTICIVEDHVPLLNSLTLLLNAEKDIRVTSSHTTAESAYEKTDWERTDILLADINLPKMSGIDLIRKIHPKHPSLCILVYTVHEDRDIVLDAIRAGACGYLIKGSTPTELISALHGIYGGGAPMSPKIARAVLSELQTGAAQEPAEEDQLTFREADILRLLETGHSYKEIASTLGVSPHTVHTHIKNIYRKLQAHGRRDAIRKGRDLGFI